jgi:predicted MFS family arabinose efflux permease
MVIYGVGFGIYKVLSNTLFVENVPPENKVVSLSLRFTAMGIGSALGAFIAGTFATVVSIPVIFGFSSIVVVTGLLAFVLTNIQ